MRLDGQRESENIEDRRSMGPAVVGGGGLLVVVAMVLSLVFGIDPRQIMQLGQQVGGQGGAQVAQGPEDEQEVALKEFVSKVLATTEDVWRQQFPALVGKPYQDTTLVLFRNGVDSACGRASSAVGPFYCPGDMKVYLDLAFFEEMRTKFKAPGDFACAYVVAHEVGHHVQNLLGLSDQVSAAQARTDKVEGNQLSVRLELQADFLAGVWAHHAQKAKQFLEAGDIAEAINAAQAIGDDTLQRQSTGRVVPDAFTHGTSKQRIKWFTHGLKTGNLEDLNLLFETSYEEL